MTAESAQALFERAFSLEQEGNQEEALACYEQALALDPDHWLSVLQRGFLRARTGLYVEAVADWEEARRLQPEFALIISDSEWAEFYQATIETVLEHFKWELALAPENVPMYLVFARAQRIFGRISQALEAASQALHLEPENAEALALSAYLLVELDQPEPAIRQYQKLLQTDPESMELNFILGQLYQRTNALGLALRHLEKVAQLDPSHGGATVALGEIYLKQGRHDLAVQKLEEAVRSFPDTAAFLMGLAECYAAQYRFDESLALYARAAEAEPDNPEVHARRGEVLLNLGDRAGAVAALERALELRPREVDVHYSLARLHQQAGDLGKAAASYEEVLKLNPRSDTAAYNLGLIFEEMKRPREAAAAYAQAAELRPSDSQYQSRLAVTSLEAGDLQAAHGALKAAVRINPNQLESQLLLGRVARELNLRQESVEAYRQVLQLDPTSEEALMGAVEELESRHLESAHRLFRQMTESHPNRPAGWEGLGRVLARMGKPMQALDALHKALLIDPSHLHALRAMAALCREYGEPGRLLECFRAVLTRRPWEELRGFVDELVNLLEPMGLYHLMLPVASFLHAQFPRAEAVARLHQLYACHLVDQGDREQAIMTLHRLLELQPDHAETHELLKDWTRQLAEEEPAPAPVQPEPERRREPEPAPAPVQPEPKPERRREPEPKPELTEPEVVFEPEEETVEWVPDTGEAWGPPEEPFNAARVVMEQAVDALCRGELSGELFNSWPAAVPDRAQAWSELADFYLDFAAQLEGYGWYREAAVALARFLSFNPDSPGGREQLLRVLETWAGATEEADLVRAAADRLGIEVPQPPPPRMLSPEEAINPAPPEPSGDAPTTLADLDSVPTNLEPVAGRSPTSAPPVVQSLEPPLKLPLERPERVGLTLASREPAVGERLPLPLRGAPPMELSLGPELAAQEAHETTLAPDLPETVEPEVATMMPAPVTEWEEEPTATLTPLEPAVEPVPMVTLAPRGRSESEVEGLLNDPELTEQQQLDTLRTWTRECPDDPLVRQAVFRLLAEDDLGLVRFYRELSTQHPDDADHALNLGRAYAQAGQEQLAVTWYTRYLKSVPSADGYEELARVYGSLRKTDMAQRCREKAQQLRQEAT